MIFETLINADHLEVTMKFGGDFEVYTGGILVVEPRSLIGFAAHVTEDRCPEECQIVKMEPGVYSFTYYVSGRGLEPVMGSAKIVKRTDLLKVALRYQDNYGPELAEEIFPTKIPLTLYLKFFHEFDVQELGFRTIKSFDDKGIIVDEKSNIVEFKLGKR